MTRKPLPEPEQLNLFDAALKPTESEPASPACIVQYWPDYASAPEREQRTRCSVPAIVLWAESFTGLPGASQALLLTLAKQAGGRPSFRMCLASLARDSEMSINTCKRHLEKLLASQLVMLKPWIEPTIRSSMVLGYEFRLIVDIDDQAAGRAKGFTFSRRVGHLSAGLADG